MLLCATQNLKTAGAPLFNIDASETSNDDGGMMPYWTAHEWREQCRKYKYIGQIWTV